MEDDSNMEELYKFIDFETDKEYDLNINQPGKYIFVYDISVDADVLAQYWCSIFVDDNEVDNMSICGTNGDVICIKSPVLLEQGNHKLRFDADKKVSLRKLTLKI